MIQFEYSRAATARGVTLGELHRLLAAAGYVVGKLHPDGVRFAPCAPQRDEDFPGLNDVAVRTDDISLREAVAPARHR